MDKQVRARRTVRYCNTCELFICSHHAALHCCEPWVVAALDKGRPKKQQKQQKPQKPQKPRKQQTVQTKTPEYGTTVTTGTTDGPPPPPHA
jgi:hypothetical protein